MQDFRKLKVWEKSHRLVLDIYQVTQSFPKEELYGLTSQIRRSSASVATNISEGCGRGSNGSFKQFLHIAMGSASEVEYQLLLAHDLGYNRTLFSASQPEDRRSEADVSIAYPQSQYFDQN